jgi:hypothetical protein
MEKISHLGVKYLLVVFLQKLNDTHVILKRYLLSLRKEVDVGHITTRSLKCSNDVLGQRDRVELEVRLEEKVDDVVSTPFARLLQRCSVKMMSQESTDCGMMYLSLTHNWNIRFKTLAASSSFSFFPVSWLKSS